MNRRTWLAGIGTAGLSGLAGCLTIGRGSTNTPVGGDADARRVSIRSIDDIPQEADVTFSVEVVDDSITPESSALLTTVMENDGDESIQVKLPFYKGASSWTSEAGILLYSLEAPGAPSIGGSVACFGTDGKSKDSLAWSTEGTPTYQLGSGESHSNKLIVVDDPTATGCFPPGTYRFESDHTVRSVEFTWGFELRIAPFSE